MDKYIVGIDVGGTTVKLGLFTTEGVVAEKWEIKTNKEDQGSHILSEIADAVFAKLEEKGIAKSDVLGAGLGVPGPVRADGTVVVCVNLGWGTFNVCEEMSKLLGMPVAAGNDANVAALGEMWKGGGQGYTDIVMVTLGTGVGGGIIINGKICAGSNGAGGELGHMIVNPEETDLCGCGCHGHLEQYASATGIVRMAKKELAENAAETSLRGMENLQAKDIFDAAKSGDAVAAALVDKLCRILATALTHVAATTDPQAFVIGGGVSKAGAILTDGLKKHYNQNLLSALLDKDFCLATLGNDAGIYGSAKLILDQLQ